ncbi:MAG: hypothetical protein KJO05_00430 [Bacteroidia bacterium]|nr:hypothetical protein [Bacteroidia bacterium]NNF30830.1 hypothetical protein [Flavobacteriaceae bacterium]MBT8275463.1 hypothetical protein [Bacteroidia bacterium]NNJ82003.1 hypothetical protein [Flavobacteriaceae bacterium]NNK54443.1 hypothetical protein [Flavobacteriaceae bacterium]
MKIVFTFIVGIHALIHVMGFLKGFGYAEIGEISKAVSRLEGILWLTTSLLFMSGIILMHYNNLRWKWLLLLAVLISQALIITVWPDARFGSLPNLLIALVLLFGYSENVFRVRSEKLAKEILVSSETLSLNNTIEDRINNKPPIVQKWLRASMHDSSYISSVRLQQKGRMRTKPQARWMPFTAEQYISIPAASYIWTTEVELFSDIDLTGRDKLESGEGETSIKLMGLIPIVNEKSNPKINSGSLMRYLAEICWYPTAALDNRIHWESVGDTSAEASMMMNGVTVTGTFYFTPDGNFEAFESQRFYGGGDNSNLETWHIEALDYDTFHGVQIPNKAEITWKFLEGDFKWLELEVIDIDYNTTEVY